MVKDVDGQDSVKRSIESRLSKVCRREIDICNPELFRSHRSSIDPLLVQLQAREPEVRSQASHRDCEQPDAAADIANSRAHRQDSQHAVKKSIWNQMPLYLRVGAIAALVLPRHLRLCPAPRAAAGFNLIKSYGFHDIAEFTKAGGSPCDRARG